MKRFCALFLCFVCLLSVGTFAGDEAEDFVDTTDVIDTVAETKLDIAAKSCLLMELETGTVLYAENEHEVLPPASVTKVMSLLLVFEALADGRISKEDIVCVSEHAAGKGGSQVYLSPGEEISVHELIKCVAVSSGNDATAALAEHVAGSEEAFVVMMNEKAAQLGMENSTFLNCSGLDDEGSNYTSAYDVALMSRALMQYEGIFEYTTIWMDSIRDGGFGLNNTNRLVRFYSGTTGLKTGSTSKAGFCISATAQRDGLHLIAVIMGSETGDIRNAQAKKLLDHGFANYAITHITRLTGFDPVPVAGGKEREIVPFMREEKVAVLVGKGERDRVETRVTLTEGVTAPVEQGQTLGTVEYFIGDRVLYTVTLVADRDIERVDFGFMFKRAFEVLMF